MKWKMKLEEFLDTLLIKSEFAKPLIRGSNVQLYHTLLMKVMYLDEESLKVFDEFKEGVRTREIVAKFPESKGLIEGLVSANMLVEKGINEEGIIKRSLEKEYDSNSLTIMYLLPTDKCNLRCKYCFIENSMGKDYSYTYMSKDIMKRGIDFFAGSPIQKDEKKVIILYGGEPLMNPEIVKDAIKYSKENFPGIGINIVTNGTLVTKDIAKFFLEMDVFVGVSVDGPKEVNDKIRVFRNGLGAFDSMRRGYERLKLEDCQHLGISFTIASHNLNNLKKNVEYLVKEFEPNAFGFNFLVDNHFGTNPYSVPIELATDEAIEAFKYLREEGIFEERMMRKIKPFIKGTIHLKDCGAIGNQIILAPNGDIGPCQAFLPIRKYFTQNIQRDKIDLDDTSFGEWKSRYPLKMKECSGCEAIGICGGGCPYQSYLTKGSIWEMDERMCTHNKKFLNWLLWDLYDLKNGNTSS